MKNNNLISATLEYSGKLLWWFVQKVNFKIWKLLWTPLPKPNWNKIAEIALRTGQLLFSVPVLLADLAIILLAVLLYIFSIVLIFAFFLVYAVIIKIFSVIMDKAVSPVLKILSIAAGIFLLFYIYKSDSWTDLYSKLGEFWQYWF